MTSLVLDTQAIIWYLDDSTRLSQAAGDAIQDAITAGFAVYVSAVTIVEITYLVEKGKLTTTQHTNLLAVLHDSNSGVRIAPVDLRVAEQVGTIPRSDVPDMPDRIIGATALQLGLPLVTSDAKLQASGITTVW